MLNVSVTDMVLQPGVARQPHTTPLNAALFNQDGTPFTALSEEANQAAFQADTVAADLAALKVDFNALLDKLQAAGLMASA